MRIPIRFAFLAMTVMLTTQTGFMALPALAEETSADGVVTAYYFHGTFRCPTCRKLERYSKEAIANNFKDDLASGKLVFKVVNVEDKGNEHFVSEYQLYTKSLVLSKTKNGTEISSRNLDKIWEYAGDKKRFQDYVRDEVAASLKKET